MKLLLLGAGGQVGWELERRLPELGEVAALGRADANLEDLDGLAQRVRAERPQVIVNAAAYNQVDRAESEPEAAHRVNSQAVGVLGGLASELDAALIHYSTDFVFDGTKGAAYVESDATNPLSAYARSKLAGEAALVERGAPALILRTAWVYSLRRKSFVSMMLELARRRETLRVVTDKVGSPTWCGDLARATVDLLRALGEDPHRAALEARGVYHAAGGGQCSRYELARAAIELDPRSAEHVVRHIEPATTDEFPAAAERPASAPLDCSKLASRFDVRLAPWRDALVESLKST